MDTGIPAGMAVYLSVCAQSVVAIIEFRILLPSLKLSTFNFYLIMAVQLNLGEGTIFSHNVDMVYSIVKLGSIHEQ